MRRLRELYAKISRRILLIPAIAGILMVFLRSFCCLAATVAFAGVFCLSLAFISEKKGRQLMSLLLTLFVSVYICGFFIVYSADVTEPVNRKISLDCKVHDVDHTLDGKYRIRVYSRRCGYLEFKLETGHIPVSGEQLVVEAELYEPEEPRNPGQFDYESYLKRRGIYFGCRTLSVTCIKEAPAMNRYLSSAEYFLYGLRTKILDLYGERAPLAASVFLGDSSLADDCIRSLYQRNGCAHLLAVSGTHFAGFLSLVTYFLNKRKRTRLSSVIYVSFCVFLASFTGWSSSVTRSCIMCSASYCSRDTLSGLSIACLLMTLADPYNALSYGFLMTCSASIGILYMTPIIRSKADAVIGKSLSSAISPVISSQIGMLPFIALTSQKYGVIPLTVQLITSFIASAACAFFVPSVILSLLLASVFIAPSEILLIILDSTVKLADGYYFGIKISSMIALAVLLLTAVLILRSTSVGKLLRIPALSLLCVGILSSMAGIFYAPEAKLVFIDVGQGDSCLILCGGKSVLIDGGTYDAGKDDVLSVLDYYDIRRVDVAIATHWDRDHLGGMLCLYEMGRIDMIYTSYTDPGPKQIEIMEEYLPGESIEDLFIQLSAGDRIEMSPVCTLDVIYPRASDVSNGENDDSVVIKLACNGISVLFTGDLGIDGEEELLSCCSIGKADILKAGHHGSAFSTGYAFLNDTEPDIAVISAGINNQYGHPSSETLERFDEYDTVVLSTQDVGAVTVDIYTDRYKITGYLKSH